MAGDLPHARSARRGGAGPGGGGAASGHGARVDHARQQRDRRDSGHRRDCGSFAPDPPRRACTSMRLRASANARWMSTGGASISCRCRRTRSTGRKGSELWSCPASAAFSCNRCSTAAARSVGLRSGTVATHQVVGMGEAFALARTAPAAEAERIAELQERLWRGLSALGGVLRNGDPARCVPHLLNVSFEGVEGESLLAAVRPHIAVSTGSACTSDPSGTFLCAARARPRRSARRKQPALRSRPLLERGRRRYGGPGGFASREAAAHDRRCMKYNELTRRYFDAAACAGVLEGDTFAVRPAAGRKAPGCSSTCKSMPLERPGVIQSVRFLAFGCPARHRRLSAWLAEQAAGRELIARLPESLSSLRERFGVPVEKLGRLLTVEDAWISAAECGRGHCSARARTPYRSNRCTGRFLLRSATCGVSRANSALVP